MELVIEVYVLDSIEQLFLMAFFKTFISKKHTLQKIKFLYTCFKCLFLRPR